MTAKPERSGTYAVRFLNHRAWCEKCFTHTIRNREAELCEEGNALREKFLPLWDAEGEALNNIGKAVTADE